MNDNNRLLEEQFHKKNSLFLYSGTLALEYAMRLVEDIKDKCVIIPNNVCYNVLLSVLQVGAIPIIVEPENNVVLSLNDIKRAMKNYTVHVVIMIHYLGIRADIKSIRDEFPYIIIIEDSAQYFPPDSNKSEVGVYSDYLITSFGATKLLGNGIGGAILSDYELNINVSSDSISSRRKSNLLYPYLLPTQVEPDLVKLIQKARKKIQKQQLMATLFKNIFCDTPVIYWENNKNKFDDEAWNRFPIWCSDRQIYRTLICVANKYNIKYQLQHSQMLEELPILRNYQNYFVSAESNIKNFIMIRTYENNKKEVELWKKHLLEILRKNS